MAEEKKPNCELRCRFCPRKWQGYIPDAPHWGVVYSICSLCYTSIMDEFERQFPRKGKKLRLVHEDDGA